MKFLMTTVAAAAALAAAGSAHAYDAINGLTVNDGWGRNTGVAGMAYFTLPFHATQQETAEPRFGIAMTAPQMQRRAGLSLRTDAPKLMDFALHGASLDAPWRSSLSVGNAIAWTSDPAQMTEAERRRFIGDSGVSWVIVGAATVALFVGVYAIIDDDVPPPAEGPEE